MSKQIKVSDNVYDILNALKTEDDTFSDVIRKLVDDYTRIQTENIELRTDKENLIEILKNFKC